MGNNFLSELPQSLSNLTNLEELVMNSNELVSLPSFINQFTHLHILIANSNSIYHIPEELAGLNLFRNIKNRIEGIIGFEISQ